MTEEIIPVELASAIESVIFGSYKHEFEPHYVLVPTQLLSNLHDTYYSLIEGDAFDAI